MIGEKAARFCDSKQAAILKANEGRLVDVVTHKLRILPVLPTQDANRFEAGIEHVSEDEPGVMAPHCEELIVFLFMGDYANWMPDYSPRGSE